MKPRKVILTIEVETGAKVAMLRRARRLGVFVTDPLAGPADILLDIVQIQANVIKPAPKAKR